MKTWVKVILGIAVVGIVAGFLVFHFLYNKPHPNYETMEPAWSLTAGDLYKAFTANKADAEKKYNGKMIAVTGKISKVESTDSLTVCIFVFNQGMFGDEGVRCTMLPDNREKAKSFKPDGEVKLKGFCTGYNDTDVILEKCSILNQ